MNNLNVLSKFSPIHEINLSEFDIFKHTSKISINENRKFNICIFSLSEKVSIIKLPVRKRIVKIKISMRFYWGHWGHPHDVLQILGLWWVKPKFY